MSSIPLPPPPPPPLPSNGVKIQSNSIPASSNDARSALLSDITKGVQLKKCNQSRGNNPLASKTVQFLDGHNNGCDDDSSLSGQKVKDDFKSALHAELTNTLKKRKNGVTSENGEEPQLKNGVRTFDPNILNTHVPQPTGLKIGHSSPNFTIKRNGSPPLVSHVKENGSNALNGEIKGIEIQKMTPKCHEKISIEIESPKILRSSQSPQKSPEIESNGTVTPKVMSPTIRELKQQLSQNLNDIPNDKAKIHQNGEGNGAIKKSPEISKKIVLNFNNASNGIDTVDCNKPESPRMKSPTVQELKKQLSINCDDKINRNSPPKVTFVHQNSVTSKGIVLQSPSNDTEKLQKQDEGQKMTSPSIKELKKQLSVASQTDEIQKADKKVQKLTINFKSDNDTPDFPLKSPKKYPKSPKTTVQVTNGNAKKISHPTRSFTLPRKPTTPSSPGKQKSFQKENNVTFNFNKPTIASLQRQHTNNVTNNIKKTDKTSHNVIRAFNTNNNHDNQLNNNNKSHKIHDKIDGIPLNYDKKSQISFSKDLSNAKNYHQETVKTSKIVTTKSDLYFNNINLANVKLEINTQHDNVIRVVPKHN
uniref:CSON000317 protein n=1 Tax=Culicoides sonorensis TaxID=179676 RepID=A0A336MRS5_CULSO